MDFPRIHLNSHGMALKEGTTILSIVHCRFIHKNYIGMAKFSQKPQNGLSKILQLSLCIITHFLFTREISCLPCFNSFLATFLFPPNFGHKFKIKVATFSPIKTRGQHLQ